MTSAAPPGRRRKALRVDAEPAFDNGLARFAGTWSEQDLAEFEEATRCFEAIDWEQWSEAARSHPRAPAR